VETSKKPTKIGVVLFAGCQQRDTGFAGLSQPVRVMGMSPSTQWHLAASKGHGQRSGKPRTARTPSSTGKHTLTCLLDAPSLAVSKARLDGALSNLGWWKMSLLMAGRLEPDDLQGPFQPKPFYDSMIKTTELLLLPDGCSSNSHPKTS